MKCPSCGAENDAANRFCDQCGSRLESNAPVQPQAATPPPAAGAARCPACGAAVVPGEAFCDDCGASLSGVVSTPPASYDAPTIYAPPVPSAAASTAAQSGAQALVCPNCGHQNMAGDLFCDNCGASLQAPTPIPPAEAPTAAADATLLQALQSTPPTNAISPGTDSSPASELPEATPPPADPTTAPSMSAIPIVAGTGSTNDAVTVTAPPEDILPPLPDANAQAAPDAQGVSQAQRQQVEDEIARQQQIITQFEQMQATFGAATPAAVTQGLAEARDALARAQAELAALPAPAPAIDPAVVARLNDEIARQQQIITQFEQMQATFGAATPAAVTQGLAEARDALARAQAELAALGGVSSSGATAQATSPAATPESPATTAGTSTPVQTPIRAATPRLVVEGAGQELPLPIDKREITIGREDPISGIFPEVDMTAFGGEGGGVSRQHARILHDGDQWSITDLNSTNYTRVDGTKVEPNQSVPIHDGARIQLGRITVIFHNA